MRWYVSVWLTGAERTKLDNFIGGTVYYTYTNAEFIVRRPFRENKGLSISATATVGVYVCTVTTQNSCSTSFQQEVIGLTCK